VSGDVHRITGNFKLRQQWRRSLTSRLTIGQRGPFHTWGGKLHPHWPADDFGYSCMNGRAELTFEPRHVKWIRNRHADYARAGVVRQTACTAQIGVKVRLVGIEL
jgi:hypothetical protein